MIRAVFIDRDDTLIIDKVYLKDPAGVELISGSQQAICRWREAGYCVVLITNQSGVGRGIVTEAELAAQHLRLAELLGREARLDGIYSCVHHPDHGCECRKPKPGLLHTAAAELGIALDQSWMLGDKPADVEAGLAAGCRTVQISRQDCPLADLYAPDLATAAQLICP
ncbi:MAG: D-glycero-D-manno-heptose 1,7-bisphosphate phosphatase [Rhodothermales bacterium]|jgi:D-glycero-D-manno-heptose 1,7-bisphosphate phosphatase